MTVVGNSRLADALADRYRLDRELGRGGMATVFLAQDLKHSRLVALKVLHKELASALGPDRFLREIRIAASLSHPNILPLYDSGTWSPADSAPGLYYTMPFVEGESLRSRLTRERQLSLEDALRIAGDVAAALAYAHEQGVIHRDIKPENILLSGYPPQRGTTADWRVFLADFGIAKAVDAAGAERLTETGLALGTPAYMSPEQAGAERQLDQRSDLYALGCVLYEMLAGQPPFTGVTARAVMARHALDPVPSLRSVRPTVSESLDRTVTRLLAKVPADRFTTAGELGQALAGGQPGIEPERGRPSQRRFVLPAAVAAALGAVVLSLRLWHHPVASGPPADPRVVVVLPFRAAGADPALQYLREGMVDLLAIKLTGEGGPRAANPRAALSAWRRAGGSPTRDPTPDAALGIARALGAGRLIDGGIVGTAQHVTFTASVIQVPSGRTGATASVEGPPDSVPALVDRLTAQLLAGEAGRTELASLTSLPALRAYFEGQRAYRLGRWNEALKAYDQALQADSTFALAAMGLGETGLWAEASSPRSSFSGRTSELAWANRARLSPRDRAVLLAGLGPRYPEPSTMAERLAAWEQAVAAVPDSPEMWYELGDQYYHWGAMVGVKDPISHAADAFRRSLALDSASAVFPTYVEPLQHLIEIAAATGDTSSLHRLVTSALTVDSTTDNAGFFRWILAATSGDSAAITAARSRFPQMSRPSLLEIAFVSQELGMGWQDAEQALAALRAAYPSGAQPEDAYVHVLALNRGRQAEGVQATAALPEHEPRERLHWRVLDALYWDGDTAAGAGAARELTRYADARPARDDEEREAQLRDLCVEQQWRLAHGDSAATSTAIGRLRSGDPNSLCARVLEAWLATISKRSDARLLLDRLDSLLLTGANDSPTLPPNLVLARLREAVGDSRGALAAIRRRMYGAGQRWFLSTYLREEGRLAALTGDTTSALAAYRHYLALRSDPDPVLKPEVARVRAELAELVAEPR